LPKGLDQNKPFAKRFRPKQHFLKKSVAKTHYAYAIRIVFLLQVNFLLHFFKKCVIYMSKRCPPGVICIENVTIVFVIIILLSVLCFIHYKNKNNNNNSRPVRNNNIPMGMGMGMGIGMDMNMIPRPPLMDDVLLNPYDPPVRDDRYIRSDPILMNPMARRIMPINVPTQSIDTDYRQVGILTRLKGKETILPLMGRPLFTNRDKWNFYTMNDSNNVVKLPIIFKGRSCTSEYGCDNLYTGDTVFVEGYNDAFKVTSYDTQIMRYIPFI